MKGEPEILLNNASCCSNLFEEKFKFPDTNGNWTNGWQFKILQIKWYYLLEAINLQLILYQFHEFMQEILFISFRFAKKPFPQTIKIIRCEWMFASYFCFVSSFFFFFCCCCEKNRNKICTKNPILIINNSFMSNALLKLK